MVASRHALRSATRTAAPARSRRVAATARAARVAIPEERTRGRSALTEASVGQASRTAMPGEIRLALMCALFAGCALVVVWRLATFQLVDTAHYRQLAEDERHAEIPIIPSRGGLLDTNGSPLAVSVRYDSVYVLGSLVGGADKAHSVAAALSPVLSMSEDELRQSIDPKNGRPVVLKSGVPSAIAGQVEQLGLPGVYLDKEPIRQYPEGSLAAQIIGFIGRDFNGLAGLELSYAHELAGTPGVIDT